MARRVTAGGQWLRRRSKAFLVGLPVVFGISVLPMTGINTTTAENRGAADLQALMSPRVEWPAQPPLLRSDLSLQSLEEGLDPARPGSTEAAEQLLGEQLLEKVREQFFRRDVPFGWIIYREAKRNGLSPELVAAVVKTESDFRPTLISRKNAQGLMQIVPSTGELMGGSDLMNPAVNVRTGTRYLRYLFQRYGSDMKMVLAAYNAGEGNVDRFGGVPPFRETHDYLVRVAQSRRDYQRRLQEQVEQILASGDDQQMAMLGK
ncbi:MAG: lytic transglycosylase domain-containing protein [Thermoanaerobaculia bacterium]